MPLNLMKIVHLEDPRGAIWRKVDQALTDGLASFEIQLQGVLIATYIRPTEAKIEGSSLLVPHEVVKDDPYQSKVGMVLKRGPTAFVDDGNCQFHGFNCEPGDWVLFRASEGLKFSLGGSGGIDCRLLADVYVKMKFPHPDMVF